MIKARWFAPAGFFVSVFNQLGLDWSSLINMTRLILAVSLLFVMPARGEVEFWAVIYQPGSSAQASDMTLASQITDVTGRSLTLNSVLLPRLPDALNKMSGQEVIVSLPPSYYFSAREKGMIPLMRYKADLLLGLYQDPLRGDVLIKTVATPPKSSTAALVAKSLTDERVTTLETQSHTACIRMVVAGQADACATGQFFIDQYAERFGIELVPRDELSAVPPVVLFVSPDIPKTERDLIAQSPLTNGFFEYTNYIPERDDPLFERFKDAITLTKQ